MDAEEQKNIELEEMLACLGGVGASLEQVDCGIVLHSVVGLQVMHVKKGT